MKKVMTFALMMLSTTTSAQQFEDDPFAELDAEMSELENEGSEQEMAEFQQWKDEYLAEYQKFREEHFGRMDDIRDKIIENWGEAELSDNTKYVEYGDSAKTVIDFEKEEIRVSILHENDEQASLDQAVTALTSSLQLTSLQETSQNQSVAVDDKQKVLESFIGEKVDQQQAKQLFTQAVKQSEQPKLTDNKQALIAQQVTLIEKQTEAQKQQIEKLIDLDSPAPKAGKVAAELQMSVESKDEEADKQRIAKELKILDKEKQERVAKLKKRAEKLELEPNKRQKLAQKRITTFTIPLKNKKHTDRAKPYVKAVKQHSETRKLSPSLMLAVMHTESYFNPRAQSHIPAFGLMQIVPRTAGRDVNRFLHNKDEDMAVSVLYEPTSNIEAGAAYLHILDKRYLKSISNPQSRLYCAIAAYNTGAGNVARTFNKDGSRNIRKAAKVINSMNPDEVYQHLLKNLPYEETRNYLKKVTDRRNIYTFLDSA